MSGNPSNATNDNPSKLPQVGQIVRGCLVVVSVDAQRGTYRVRFTNPHNPK